MKLVRSNRTESLVEALASSIERTPLGPFDSEAIVVQSRGMERWLTLELAKRLSVWANPSFPFPRSAVETALEALGLGASERSRAYEPARLKWSIASVLSREPLDDALEGYLGRDLDPDRVLRLAASLAQVFDEYIVYRPSLLRSWERGADSDWQATLWRRLASKLGPYDIASRIEEAQRTLSSAGPQQPLGFKRLHLFSLETLPPLFLRFFGALSNWVPVRVYLQTPTSEYLSNVDKTGQLSLAIGPVNADGHPLLSSLGGLARDFQELFVEADSIEEEEDRWQVPRGDTLLSAVQRDVLELRPPPPTEERATIDRDDDSISIHACTSPMREVLVLHDLVRQALEDIPTLEPEDIVVMAPDLDAYAPAFRAVFGRTDGAQIPYEVHDRRARDDAAFYDDFLAALDVLDSRFSVLDVVRLMDARSWRAELLFSPTERARLTEMLEVAGIRWGIDDAHRESLGFPREGLHTWRSGLCRLFLGFATTPGPVEAYEGLLPRGELSIDDAELVARLSRLTSVLFAFHERASADLSVPRWVELLGQLAAQLFAEESDSTGAVRVLRTALHSLAEAAIDGDYAQAVPLRTIRRELAVALRQSTPATGFLRRGVTLSELVPLRSIPFRVVCLIGMSEESFPRRDDRPSFDVLRSRHALGDRNKRTDDRHSFLQAILCARDRLIVTYGAPAASTRIKPTPSPVVWELGECLDRYYSREGVEPVVPPIEHPLHGFDERYFKPDTGLSSYSNRHLEIARAMRRPVVEVGPVDLRSEEAEPKRVLSIQELSQWIWYPAREFIQQRLRTRIQDSTLYEPSGALVELDKLDSFRVGNAALERELEGDALATFLNASPEFPDGAWGSIDRADLAREVEAIAERQTRAAGRGTPRTELVTAEVSGIRLEARIDGIYGDKRVKRRFNRAETKTELSTWLEHLLMHASSKELPTATELILRDSKARGSTVRLGRIEGADALLGTLVDLYAKSQTAPVALLNRPSWAFAAAVLGGKESRALDDAQGKYKQDARWDRYARFSWGREGPFVDARWCEEFRTASLAVYEPLLRARSER